MPLVLDLDIGDYLTIEDHTALRFEEKYGTKIRVVVFGQRKPIRVCGILPPNLTPGIMKPMPPLRPPKLT